MSESSLVCPILKATVRDPVLLVAGRRKSRGIFDRQALQNWLLAHPNQDPVTKEHYHHPLKILSSRGHRKLLVATFGIDAYVPCHDRKFASKYREAWRLCVGNSPSNLYKKLDNLLNGMNNEKMDWLAALRLAEKFPNDAIMVGFAALIRHPDAAGTARIPKDKEKALELWSRAMELGLVELSESGNRIAQSITGCGCYYGLGMDVDYKQAFAYFRESADQGYAPSQSNLGVLYREGRGTLCDNGKAMDYFRLAADQGHSYAQVELGCMYRDGLGVPQDVSKAAAWLEKAAKQGNWEAQYYLGEIHGAAGGVANFTLAARWYHMAGDQGHVDAQFRLGECYDEGRGVTADIIKAMEWYQRAADQGHTASKERIEVLLRVRNLDLANHACVA